MPEGQVFWAGLFSKEQHDRREAELAAAAAAQARRLEAQEDDDDDVDGLVGPRERHGTVNRSDLAPPERLRVGAEVQVHSLTGEACMHYNHLRGELICLDADRGRWNVRITSAAYGGKVLALKPGNLRCMLARNGHGCEEVRLAAPREDPRFENGALVQLHSLAGAPEHNECHGVLERLDPATGRWEVKVVQNGGANKRLLVKAQNISFLLSAAEMAQAKRMNPPKGNE